MITTDKPVEISSYEELHIQLENVSDHVGFFPMSENKVEILILIVF